MTIVYRDILEWSKTRPLWQRDALRRLVLKQSLSNDDIAHLTEICKSKHGLNDDVRQIPAAIPLEHQHIPEDVEGSSGSILESISDVQNVNALVNGQCLDFLPEKGLTVVYGDNGSGKTGFVRVLKCLCRTRGVVDQIKPNIFDDSSSLPVSAVVHFHNEHQGLTLPWTADSPSPIELSSVAVFDSNAASVYVGTDNEVLWRPGGLDLFSKLVDACHRVAGQLRSEKLLLEIERLKPPEIPENTEAFRLLSTLSAETKVDVVDKLLTLGDAEKKLMQTLTKEIAVLDAEDPAKIAASLRRKIARFRELVGKFDRIEAILSDPSITSLRSAKVDMDSKIAAAAIASAEQFREEPLAGVGSQTWGVLWESAKKYSETEAYKDIEFPNVGDSARCVLCQQTLEPEAKDRMRRFHNFVTKDTHVKAEESKKSFEERFAAIIDFSAFEAQDSIIIDELKEADEVLATDVKMSLTQIEARRLAVVESVSANTLDAIPAHALIPKERVLSLITGIEEDALKYESIDGADKKTELEKKLDELKARNTLSASRDQIFREIERLKEVEMYNACLRDTETTGITKKNTELTTKVVTDALRDRFKAELKELGLESLSIELEPARGREGVLKHHLVLLSGSKKHPPIGVVSEGEYRCIALASFLAEATTSDNVSSIVLDDPVCSLDHTRKDNIARRLVLEARQRQVIIFTHDLVFLLFLQNFLEEYSVPSIARQICFFGGRPGFCKTTLPWLGMKVKERVEYLRSRLKGLKLVYAEADSEVYKKEAEAIYNDIREAWESAVEEVFLDGAVMRLGRAVRTGNLEKVVMNDLSQFYERLDRGMTESSKWCGHDQPREINQQPPKPDEIEADIEELGKWIKDLRVLYDRKKPRG